MKKRGVTHLSKNRFLKWLLVNIVLMLVVGTVLYVFTQTSISQLARSLSSLDIFLIAVSFCFLTTWHLLFINEEEKFSKINISLGYFLYGLMVIGFIILYMLNRVNYPASDGESIGIVAAIVLICSAPIVVTHSLLVLLITKPFLAK